MSSDDILLRDVDAADLPIFFEHQRDPDAQRMVAFSPRDPSDHDAFATHWSKIIADPTVTTRTVTRDGEVVGETDGATRA